MSNKKRSRGRPSMYPPEFRRDAVAMVLDEGRSIAEVARTTGVNPGTLGNWVGLERVERGERDGLTADERGDLTELRAENAQLRMERDLLKRSLAFLDQGNVDPVTRFCDVDAQKAAGFPVRAACEAAGVSTSGYYDWCAREAAGPTERQVAEADLVALMRDLFDEAD